MVNSISLLESAPDRNQQSKSAGLKSESLTIRFVTPNRISLHTTVPNTERQNLNYPEI